jgi:hypothetical protein
LKQQSPDSQAQQIPAPSTERTLAEEKTLESVPEESNT